jgi:hypothetical protein
MRNIIQKASKALTAIIIAFAVILTAILLGTSDNGMSKDFVRAFDEIGTTLDIFTIGTYIIAGLTLLLVLIFSVSNMFIKPKAAKNALIGIGALVIIIIVSYFLSTPDIDPKFVLDIAENTVVTDALSQQVGAGLIATYILAGLSVLAIIYASVSKLIKG